MSITFSGLATGLDTDKIITQLMEIERMPITGWKRKKKAIPQSLRPTPSSRPPSTT